MHDVHGPFGVFLIHFANLLNTILSLCTFCVISAVPPFGIERIKCSAMSLFGYHGY